MTAFRINNDMSPQDISRYLAPWVRTASQLSSGLHENPSRLAPQQVKQFLNEHLDPILAYFLNTEKGKQHLTPPSNGEKSWQDILNKQLQEILKTYQAAYLFVFQKNLEEYEQKIAAVVADTSRDPNDFRSMILGRQIQAPHVLKNLEERQQISDETREKAAQLMEEHIARLKEMDPLPPQASLKKILNKKPLFTEPDAAKEYNYVKETAALFMAHIEAGKARPSDIEQDARTYLLEPMIAIAADLKMRFASDMDLDLPPDLDSLDGIEGIDGHHMIGELDNVDFQGNHENRALLMLLKDLHKKYDSVIANTLPNSSEKLEKVFVTRLKTWVGTQQDFYITAPHLVSKITQTHPDLIGTYFPAPAPPITEERPDTPPSRPKEKTGFGAALFRRGKDMLSSAANFGKRTLDALTPAVKTLAAAVTAIGVSIIPQNLGPAASPAPSLTPAFNSATAAPSPATKAPAAAPADVATVSTSLPKRTATPTPRTRSAKEHHTLTAAFQQPDPAVIDGQDMRFGKETYLNACAAGIQSWVCRHFAIN